MSVGPVGRVRATLIAGAMAIATFGISSCGGGTTRSEAAPVGAADYLPAGALAYVEGSTAFDSAQWRTALDLGRRFPGFEKLIANAKKELAADDLDFDRDIRPLIGDSAAVAVLSIDPAAFGRVAAARNASTAAPDGMTFVGALEIADGREADFERRVADPSTGGAEKIDTISGANVYRLDNSSTDTSVGAVIDGAFVIATDEETLRSAVAAHSSGDTMARSQRLRRAMSMLPADTLAQGYMDMAGFTELLKQVAPAATAAQLDQLTLGPNAAVGMSVTAEDSGFRIKSVGSDYSQPAQAPSFTPTLTTSVPADALAYVGLGNLFELGRVTAQTMATGEAQAKESLNQIKGALTLIGVSPEDLENLLGSELAITLGEGPTPGTPTIGAILQSVDGSASATLLDRLRSVVPGFSDGKIPEFGAVTLANGIRGWQSKIQDDASLVYGVDGNRVVAGTSVDAVRKLQAPKLPLSEDRAFAAATDQMPAKVAALLWINGSRLWPVLKAAGAFDDAPQEALPNLERVRSVAAWSTVEGAGTVEAFVTIG